MARTRAWPARVRVAAWSQVAALGNAEEKSRAAEELLDVAAASGVRGLISRVARWAEGAHDDPRVLALAAVAPILDELDAPTRSLALSVGAGRWGAAARTMRSASDAPTILASIARLARRTGDADVIAMLPELLAHAEPAVHREAEESLLILTRDAMRASGSTEPRLDLLSVLEGPAASGLRVDRGAVEDAAARWLREGFEKRRSRAGLLAACALLDASALRRAQRGEDEGPLVRFFQARSHPAHAALRAFVRLGGDELTRARAWLWLGAPEAGSAPADRLRHASSAREHEGVLETWHLTLSPRRASALRLVKPGTVAMPTPAQISAMGARARAAVPAWVMDVVRPGDRSRAVDALAPLIADDESVVRWNLARRGPEELLRDLSLDLDPLVARAATHRMTLAGLGSRPAALVSAARDTARLEHLAILTHSPDPFVRRVAAEERAMLDAFAPGPAGALAARRWLTRDRAGFLRALLERLESAEESQRLAAIMTSRRLGIESMVLDALVRACDDASPRVVATAAGALVGDAAAQPAVLGTLEKVSAHADPRVRSNAVESLGRIVIRAARASDEPVVRRASNVIRALRDDPASGEHHRVRATALRELARASALRPAAQIEPVGPALVEMLRDARPAHRLAGVWLAERALASGFLEARGDGLTLSRREAVERLAELAGHDPDPRVLRRARAGVRRLHAELAEVPA
ncbi:MAG: HEAT repeat domain-containing protein [Planctomycetota bacterium]|nr:HEAT repeat domain-containing protein [Planctomycetota bacterium]